MGLIELIAIALGGMIGGGIFTVLGISVAMIGLYTPIAFLMGGILASLAVYSYIKLALYYQDEGATYAFFKKSFPHHDFAAALIGWWVVFGYIATLALYAYTFSSYAISGFIFGESEMVRKGVAIAIITLFLLINIWSVKGMGTIEDIIVYTKLIILIVISFVLINHSNATLPQLIEQTGEVALLNIMIVAALTFVAFEGFQLVIHAMNEMDEPKRNIPRSIYSAIIIAIGIYFILSLGAILAIPFESIIQNQEYALASGANKILGNFGTQLVIFGALLATSSAISSTLFGASRLMAVIAKDGYFPKFLQQYHKNIPVDALMAMALLAYGLILIGDLTMILEFSSITFLLVSLLMALANAKIYQKTHSSLWITIIAIIGLLGGTGLILYYEPQFDNLNPNNPFSV